MVWGFIVVGKGSSYCLRVSNSPSVIIAFFTMLVGLAMAGTSSLRVDRHFVSNVTLEICSAHPTSGGPYYWAAMISKPQGAPFASWVTGWFNLLGQIAVTTGIGFVIGS